MHTIEQFEEDGFIDFGEIIDSHVCNQLHDAIVATREFSETLFLKEEEFEKLNPDAFNKNPRPGCNLLDDLNELAQSVENNEVLTSFLTDLLGPDYQIMRKKLVCGVPDAWIPKWIQKKVEGQPSNNLAHFVRPEYTDMTYFYGIDFHQDLVDWQNRSPDFVTVYVYIDDVSPQQAPLFVLPRSHKLGHDIFPHNMDLLDAESGNWAYETRDGKSMTGVHTLLARPKGSVFLWHALTLHGTQPATVPEPRISIRYLIEKRKNTTQVAIDKINARIGENLEMETPRDDLDINGIARVSKNHLHKLAQIP